MYPHKHLAAYLYLILGSVFNKSTESLPSSPNKLPAWNVGLKCLNPLLNRFDGLAKADTWQIDGPGCAITLNCLLDPRNGSTPSVNVTITLPGDEATGTQQCKEGLEGLILGGGGDEVVRILAVQRQPDVEHNRPHRKRPTFLSSRQSEESSEPGSEEEYRGIFDYLLSTIQRRAVQKTAGLHKDGKRNFQGKFARSSIRDRSTQFSENLKRTVFEKRSLSYHLARCEESFCHGYNLEKTCGPNGRTHYKLKPPNICEMCYPRRKNLPIRNHCERRIEKEMRAFYAICALLGLSIVVAALLYLFRVKGRRLRMRYQLFWGMRKNQLFAKSPTARSTFSTTLSTDSPPTLVPGLFSNAGMDTTRERDNTATNDTGSSVTFSMFQQKFNQLGAISMGYRKRIQDVFDIESLEPKHVEDKNLNEKVFVLPRAPNASSQRYPTRISERARRESHGDDHLEMEESGTVRVFARGQNDAV